MYHYLYTPTLNQGVGRGGEGLVENMIKRRSVQKDKGAKRNGPTKKQKDIIKF